MLHVGNPASPACRARPVETCGRRRCTVLDILRLNTEQQQCRHMAPATAVRQSRARGQKRASRGHRRAATAVMVPPSWYRPLTCAGLRPEPPSVPPHCIRRCAAQSTGAVQRTSCTPHRTCMAVPTAHACQCPPHLPRLHTALLAGRRDRDGDEVTTQHQHAASDTHRCAVLCCAVRVSLSPCYSAHWTPTSSHP